MKHLNFQYPEEFEKLFRGNNPEITDAIVNGIAEGVKYQKDTGKEIYYKVQNAKKTLEYNVSTIHSYCNAIAKQVTKGIEFDLDDYEIMAQMYPLFSKHTRSKKFKDIESLFKLHPDSYPRGANLLPPLYLFEEERGPVSEHFFPDSSGFGDYLVVSSQCSGTLDRSSPP